VKVAVVGEHNNAYPTHRALDEALNLFPADVEPVWVRTDDPRLDAAVAHSAGVWLVPGTPYADDEAALRVISHARTTNQPFLGTCGGFQYAVMEFARHVAGFDRAAHAEVDPSAECLAITALGCSLVGTITRVQARPDTMLAAICGEHPFDGMHWCNYAVSETLLPQLQAAGLVVNSDSTEAGPEGIELGELDFFVATLFQPQWGAGPGTPLHPLIEAFINAVRAKGHTHV
jgi:CTP synthase (UTP-ammonia lyase)